MEIHSVLMRQHKAVDNRSMSLVGRYARDDDWKVALARRLIGPRIPPRTADQYTQPPYVIGGSMRSRTGYPAGGSMVVREGDRPLGDVGPR